MLNREKLAVAITLNVVPDEFETLVEQNHVLIRRRNQQWSLVPTHIGEGLPADVRRWFELKPAAMGVDDIAVLTARKMSSGARRLLAEREVSWADGDGFGTIQDGRGLHLARLSAARRVQQRSMSWSAAVAATAEVALEYRRREGPGDGMWVGRPSYVAEVSGFSYAQTSKALSVFDEQGYTRKVGAERGPSAMRELIDPGRLLSDWAGHHARVGAANPVYQFHVPWRSAEDSVDLLMRTPEIDWVISGSVAAARVAPYLTQTPDLLAYVSLDQLEAARRVLLEDHDVSEVDSGGRIRMEAAPPQVFVLSSQRDGAKLAPIVRIYADLLRMRSRGAEAAEFLRETSIGF